MLVLPAVEAEDKIHRVQARAAAGVSVEGDAVSPATKAYISPHFVRPCAAKKTLQ